MVWQNNEGQNDKVPMILPTIILPYIILPSLYEVEA